MRLLFLTSRLPYPPDRGDRLRTFHFLQHLGREHAVTLVSFTSRKEEKDKIPYLQPFCQQIHLVHLPAWRSALTALLNFWRGQPLQQLYYRSAAMKKLVERLVAGGRFDGAYIHLFRMAPYLEKDDQLFRVVDLTDVISTEIAASLPYRSAFSYLLYRFELPRISAVENKIAGWAEDIWLISAEERANLTTRCPQARVTVIPSGVDIPPTIPQKKKDQPPTLIFLGHMRVFHNIDAAEFLVRDIYPRVQAQIPGCRLRIIGQDPHRRVRDLAHIEGVTVTGFVADLAAEFALADVAVVPLRFSAGIQQKVLESMAAALPVVATRRVNAGLGAQEGVEILLGDDGPELAVKVINLLADEKMREKIGQAGRLFVAQNFSWQPAVNRWRAIEQDRSAGPDR